MSLEASLLRDGVSQPWQSYLNDLPLSFSLVGSLVELEQLAARLIYLYVILSCGHVEMLF